VAAQHVLGGQFHDGDHVFDLDRAGHVRQCSGSGGADDAGRCRGLLRVDQPEPGGVLVRVRPFVVGIGLEERGLDPETMVGWPALLVAGQNGLVPAGPVLRHGLSVFV
jgi:hypothetical protein